MTRASPVAEAHEALGVAGGHQHVVDAGVVPAAIATARPSRAGTRSRCIGATVIGPPDGGLHRRSDLGGPNATSSHPRQRQPPLNTPSLHSDVAAKRPRARSSAG
jgi:hypothetical protein